MSGQMKTNDACGSERAASLKCQIDFGDKDKCQEEIRAWRECMKAWVRGLFLAAFIAHNERAQNKRKAEERAKQAAMW